jgi:hypothetical protein
LSRRDLAVVLALELQAELVQGAVTPDRNLQPASYRADLYLKIHQPGGPVTTQEQRVVNPQEQIAARGTIDKRPMTVSHCALPQAALLP